MIYVINVGDRKYKMQKQMFDMRENYQKMENEIYTISGKVVSGICLLILYKRSKA